MKLKNFMFVAALLSALTFSSCSNDENFIPSKSSTSKNNVTFDISIPVRDVTTYATQQKDDEVAINSLYIVKFDEGGNMVDTPASIYSNLDGKSPDFSYTTNFESDTLDANKAVYRFLFIANLDLSTLDASINTVEAFNSYLSTTLTDSTTCHNLVTTPSDSTDYTIPMTGIGYQNGSPFVTLAGGSKIKVIVNLTRIVARIDVVNNMDRLNITGLRLLNTIDKSYLLSAADCENLNDNDTYNKTALDANKITTLPFTTIDPTNGLGLKTGMDKAFYLYEESKDFNRCCSVPTPLTLEVTVNYAGTVSTFDIPFIDKNGNGIEIKRNYLYKVILGTSGDTNSDEIGFSITCDNWNFKFAKVLIDGSTNAIIVD